MYADDVVLLSPSVAGLSKLISLCGEFGKTCNVLYNAKKSVVLACRSKHMKDLILPRLSIEGVPLKEVDHVKYLGHIISNNAYSDDLDIDRQCKQMYKQGNVLIRRFHMCSVAAKTRLFTAFCSSMYTAHLWSNYRQCMLRRLMVAYHTVLKTMLGISRYESSSHTCVVHRVPHCAVLIRQRIYNFMCRLSTCDSELVKKIENSSVKYRSRLRRHWNQQLYVHFGT